MMIHFKNNATSSRRLGCLVVLMTLLLSAWSGIGAKADNSLFVEPVVGKVNKTVSIPIYLTNDDEVVAMQFDITLPFAMPSDGIVTMTNRSDGHAVSSRANGKTVTVLLSSMSNKALKGNSGMLLRLPMEVYDDGNTATPYPITLSNIVLTDRTGKNIATETSSETTFTVSKENMPDLTVGDVAVAPLLSAVSPASSVPFVYTVTNSGDGATLAGWTAMVYMENLATGVRTYIGSQRYDQTMAAGSSVTNTFETVLPFAMHMEGNCCAYVEIVPAAGCGELIADQANNSAYSPEKMLGKALTLTSNKTLVQEGYYNGYATLTLTRSGDWSVAEKYTITSSVDKLFSLGNAYTVLPATVVIPKGSASVSFRIYATEDEIVRAKEGDISVEAAHGYESLSLHLQRQDNDRNPLTLALSAETLTEGNSLTLTVTRGGELTDALALPVACNLPTRVDALPTLEFEPGQSVATAKVTFVNDDVAQLDASVRFSVAAADYASDSRYVTLLDDDRPTLTLNISPSVISETAGNQATTAVITRNGTLTQPLTVRITTDRNEVFTGSTVVEIPAGEKSVEVPVGVTDNSAVDGSRTCTLSAVAFLPANNSYAPSTDRAYTSSKLTVTDDESPYLAVTSRNTAVAEGSSVQLTVTRYTPNNQGDMVVQLSSQATDVTFPSTVTIPSGYSSASFNVSVAKNTIADDDRSMTITANASDMGQGQYTLLVTDRTLPDAMVASVSHEGDLYSGLPAVFSAVVRNTGTAILTKGMTIDFYLATGSRMSYYMTSTPLLSATLDKDIEIGGDETFSFTADVPQLVGNRWLYAVVNANRAVNEFSTTNNTVGVFEPVFVAAPFSVTSVSTDKTDYLPGEYVLVSGKMEGKLNGQTVRVKLSAANSYSSGQYSYTDTKIDEEGNFEASVLVDRSAYGTMKVEALALGQTEASKVVEVRVYNMSLSSASTTLSCDETYQKTGTIRIYNHSAKPLTGVTLATTTLPFGCEFQLGNVPTTIAANSYADVSFTLNPTVPMTTLSYENFSVKASSAEGVCSELSFRYLCRSITANLSLDPAPLNTTLLLNSSRTVELKLTNYGLKESGAISLNIPRDVEWLSSLSPSELPSLAPGQSTTLRLQLTHREGMHSGRSFTSQLNVSSANGVARTAQVKVTVVGTEYSKLSVQAQDVYSLSGKGFSRLTGTVITVKDNRTGKEVFTGVANAKGSWTTEKITEGSYTVTLRALLHRSVSKTVNVGPGEELSMDFILPYQAVVTDFVTTQNLEDNSYKMVSHVVVDKEAPQAIVLPVFPEDAFNQESGTAQVVLQNVGSSVALAPTLLFPTSLEGVEIHAVNAYPSTLNPGESYVLQLAYKCPANQRRRIIASMVMNYGFMAGTHQLAEADIWQQLVGQVVQADPTVPEPAPIVDPSTPLPAGDDVTEEDNTGTDNLAESKETGTGAALPSVDGWVTLTYEEISKAKAGQPIHATLKVRNGGSKAMTKLRFVPDAYDYDSNDYLSDLVTCTADETAMSGFTKTNDGYYALAAGEEGELPLTFVADEELIAEGARKVLMGGQLAYFSGGIQSTAMLPDMVVTISPVGRVQLTYLVQRDYIADDLSTDAVVETAAPAEVVMMLRNVGASPVAPLTVRNHPFAVVSNNSFAPVTCQGLYAAVNQTETNADFIAVASDTLKANTTDVYHWMYQSGELAHVDQAAATAAQSWVETTDGELITEHGGTYELVRSLRSTHVGDEALAELHAADIDYQVRALSQADSYLLNTVEDENRLPDAVLTAGGDELLPVEVVSENCSLAGTSGVYTLTLTANKAGWVYGQLHDPTNGKMMLTEVKRNSDGVTVSAANFWQTTTTLGADFSVLHDNKLHFADSIAATSETYTLTFAAKPEDKLQVTTIHLLKADGTEVEEGSVTTEAVTDIRVEFNKPVKGFYVQYILVKARDEQLDLGDKIITRNNNQDFTVSLKNMKSVPGLHEVSILTDKLKERGTNAYGEGVATASWTENIPTTVRVDIQALPEESCGSFSLESGDYEYGSIDVEATAAKGYTLAYWLVNGKQLDNVDGTLACELTGNTSIRAYFVPLTHQLTIAAENGKVEGAAEGTYQDGETLAFVAVPDDGYVIDRWQINGVDYSESNDVLNYTMTEDVEVKALFKLIEYDMSLEVAQGWNWISHHMEAALTADQLKQDFVNRILAQTQEVYRDPILGFVGQMDDLTATGSVKTCNETAGCYSLTGKHANPKTTEVSLVKGWNWMGYPLNKVMPLEDALRNLSAENGDVITNLEGGYSEYVDGKWTGTIQQMVPGQGYLFKSMSDKRFKFNNTRLCVPVVQQVASADMLMSPWQVDVHAYPSLMCLTAVLSDGQMPVIDDAYVVAAFVGEECRGIGTWIDQRLYLPIHGTAGDEVVVFKAIEKASGAVYRLNERVAFQAEVLGSVAAPYQLTLGGVVTEIEAVHGVESSSSDIYHLKGHKLNTTRGKGIYIIGEKKMLVK